MPTAPPQRPPKPPEPPPGGLQTPQGVAAAAGAASAVPGLATLALAQRAARGTDDALGLAVSALRRFWTKVRLQNEEWLLSTMRGKAPADDIAQAAADENEREILFQEKAQVRFKARMAQALGHADVKTRNDKVQKAMAAERRYAVMRQEEMARRSVAAVDRSALRRASPQGVYWELDPNVKEHTPECVAMAGKLWPWEALDRFRFWPPVHGGCMCGLKSYKTAVGQGLLRPGRVPDVEDAVRAVGRIIALHTKEGDELELARTRYRIVEAGLMTRGQFDEVITRMVEEELWG